MRSISYSYEQLIAGTKRRPAYKILAYSPKLDDMSAVVCGDAQQEPLDLTQYCSGIGLSTGRLTFTLEDKDAMFHPDFGQFGDYLSDRAIIRFVEGDEGLDESEWTNTFTGQIQGQIGWRKSRRSTTLEAKVSAYSRENNQSWKRRSITTKMYTAGTEAGLMLRDICTHFMGMREQEIRVPSTLGLQLKHSVSQLVQVAPWDAVTTILEAVGRVPFFDGDGRLSCYSKSFSDPVAVVFADWKPVLDYEVPEYASEAINKIRVVFLDSSLSEVEGTYQMLGSAQATAGFFIPSIKLDCWWGDDHKQRAKGTTMVVKQSVVTQVGRMASIGNFGAQWALEDYEEIDAFHGRVTITVPWYTPALFGAALAEYLVAAYLGDVSLPFGGMTIPVGRIMEALCLIQVLGMMMCIGTGQYEIWGTPYDYVYLEKQSIAIECNLPYWLENERQIKNDLLGTQEQADAIALLELIWEKSRSFPRKMVIKDDPRLEVGDMIRTSDGLKFFITDITKDLGRGDVPLLSLTGFKVKRA
jgi:hypothetical protein